MHDQREQERQANREKNHGEVRRTPGMEFRRGTHRIVAEVVAAFVSNAELKRQVLGYGFPLPSVDFLLSLNMIGTFTLLIV